MHRVPIAMLLAAVFMFTVTGSSFALTTSQIQNRINRIQADIDDGITFDTLTANEARRVQTKLDEIRRDFYRAKRYMPITYREKRELSARLDRLEVEVRALKKTPREERQRRKPSKEITAIEERIDRLYQRLGTLRSRDAITLLEARELRENLDIVENNLQELSRERTLTSEDIDSINLRLGEIEEELDFMTRKAGTSPSLRERQEAVEKSISRPRNRISEYRENGWIRPADAKAISEDLKDIRYDLEEIADEDRLTVKELAHLEDRVEELAHELNALKEKYSRSRLTEELAEKQLILEERIDRLHQRIGKYRRNGSLSLYEARDLRIELDDIESSLRRKVRKNTLSLRDIDSLNDRLDILSKKMETMRSIPHRKTPYPPVRPKG